MAVGIGPFLWYAEQAARFYAGLIPDSRVNAVWTLPADSPSDPQGAVQVVEMTLAGRPVVAMTAKPMGSFNHAISLILTCDTQAEIDRLWDGLLQGGTPEACGWLRDRYGLSWQITPRRLLELIAGPTGNAPRGSPRRCWAWSSWMWPRSRPPEPHRPVSRSLH